MFLSCTTVSQASYPGAILIISVIGRASMHTRPDWRFRIADYPASCQSLTHLPVRHSGKGMDRIRINMNLVNCLFHLPSLNFALHAFYLHISISCLKCLSPCLDINIDASLPLRYLQARNPNWIKNPNSEALFFFFPFSISPYRPICECTHTPKYT